jgi:hypothetical protein
LVDSFEELKEVKDSLFGHFEESDTCHCELCSEIRDVKEAVATHVEEWEGCHAELCTNVDFMAWTIHIMNKSILALTWQCENDVQRILDTFNACFPSMPFLYLLSSLLIITPVVAPQSPDVLQHDESPSAPPHTPKRKRSPSVVIVLETPCKTPVILYKYYDPSPILYHFSGVPVNQAFLSEVSSSKRSKSKSKYVPSEL